MNDPQSVLRTVVRVIEAELKPESVVILMRLNGENHIQADGDAMQWLAQVQSAVSFLKQWLRS